MCVIIHRLPNIIIENEKIEAACTVNADGFGLAIADRGRIELIKELNPQGNDPERVLKLLEEAKDLPILLHLRYKTVGDVNEANCHPFTVVTHADDGTDIVMCHNGTMQQFNMTGTPFSDSYMFNEMILKPMIERSLCSPDVDPEDVLSDEFIQLVLNEFVPSSSIVSLMDGFGKTLHIHETQGFEHEGWWSSNNYSFNVQHRSKSVSTFPNYTGYNGQSGYNGTTNGASGMGHWPDVWDDYPTDQEPATPGSADYEAMQNGNYTKIQGGTGLTCVTNTLPVHTPATPEDSAAEQSKSRAEEFTKITHTLKSISTQPCPSNSMLRLATSDRPSFVTICKLNNLKEVCRLEREDIAELVHYYPEASIVLIQDLLKELYLVPHKKMTDAMDIAAEFRENEKRKKNDVVIHTLDLMANAEQESTQLSEALH